MYGGIPSPGRGRARGKPRGNLRARGKPAVPPRAARSNDNSTSDLEQERRNLRAERDAIENERLQMQQERESWRREREKLLQEKQQLETQLQQLQQQQQQQPQPSSQQVPVVSPAVPMRPQSPPRSQIAAASASDAVAAVEPAVEGNRQRSGSKLSHTEKGLRTQPRNAEDNALSKSTAGISRKNTETEASFDAETKPKKTSMFPVLKNLTGSKQEKPRTMKKGQHCFAKHHFNKPTWCDYCGDFIWGLGKQGYFCFQCKWSLHKKCWVCIGKTTACAPGTPPPAHPNKIRPEKQHHPPTKNSSKAAASTSGPVKPKSIPPVRRKQAKPLVLQLTEEEEQTLTDDQKRSRIDKLLIDLETEEKNSRIALKGVDSLKGLYGDDADALAEVQKQSEELQQRMQTIREGQQSLRKRLQELAASSQASEQPYYAEVEDEEEEEDEEVDAVRMRVLWDYTGGSELELSAQVDDILLITDQSNPEWWYAYRNSDGSEGFIPASYLEAV